nr:hypothetical protein [Tanacetum cinerariifolium]
MTTRSVGRSTAAPRGGRTGGRISRGGGRIREPTGRFGGRTGDQDGQGGNRGNGTKGGIDEVFDFSTVIAQQLQNLLPTIIAQVCNHASNIHAPATKSILDELLEEFRDKIVNVTMDDEEDAKDPQSYFMEMQVLAEIEQNSRLSRLVNI